MTITSPLPNFTLDEFACKCSRSHFTMPDMAVLHQRIQVLRTLVGHSLTLNSGYRCSPHNREINGAQFSQHVLGNAVDIDTVGWSSNRRANLIKIAMGIGLNGIGIAANFIHLDIRETPMMWHYKEH